MRKEQETIADIVAEMLSAVDANERGGDYSMATDAVRAYADRIEAAAKRERDELRRDTGDTELTERFSMCARCDRSERPAGNAAAMREALERMLAISAEMRGEYNIAPRILIDGWETMIETTAKNALSAPPRNCDRFKTLADAVLASGEATAESPALTGMGNAQLVRFIKWLFAPAEEGCAE